MDAGIREQKPWYEAAAKLLGLPPADYSQTLYIDQFVVWRRTLVKSLIAEIEATTGRDWRIALARTPQFAEYMLYGLFVEQVVGINQAEVYSEPRSLCHSRWTGPLSSAEEGDAFVAGLRADQIACSIQSTIPVAMAERARLFAKATQQAAEVDARGSKLVDRRPADDGVDKAGAGGVREVA